MHALCSKTARVDGCPLNCVRKIVQQAGFQLTRAVAAILALKQGPESVDATNSGENLMIGVDLPEVMLAEALAAGKPTVAFYHSDTCDSCIQMIDVVRQVYSEFENPIVLVDVNVCREVNEPLLQRERITYIPTMVFKDVNGKREVFVGVMKPEQFRDELVRIGGGN